MPSRNQICITFVNSTWIKHVQFINLWASKTLYDFNECVFALKKDSCASTQSLKHYVDIRNGVIAQCLQPLLLELRRFDFLYLKACAIHSLSFFFLLIFISIFNHIFLFGTVSMGGGDGSYHWTPNCNYHCHSRRSITCQLHFWKTGKTLLEVILKWLKLLLSFSKSLKIMLLIIQTQFWRYENCI